MDFPIRRQDLLRVHRIWISFEICDAPVGFLQNDQARRSIPRMEIQFPESVTAAHSGVAHIESGRTAPADALACENKRLELVHSENDFLANAVRKTGCQQAIAEPVDAGHLKPPAIEK